MELLQVVVELESLHVPCQFSSLAPNCGRNSAESWVALAFQGSPWTLLFEFASVAVVFRWLEASDAKSPHHHLHLDRRFLHFRWTCGLVVFWMVKVTLSGDLLGLQVFGDDLVSLAKLREAIWAAMWTSVWVLRRN